MRLKEILIENYTQQLDTDLDNILVGAKAAGIYNLNPAVVVQNLQKMGYSVDWNEYPMEHSVNHQELMDISRFLQQVLATK